MLCLLQHLDPPLQTIDSIKKIHGHHIAPEICETFVDND